MIFVFDFSKTICAVILKNISIVTCDFFRCSLLTKPCVCLYNATVSVRIPIDVFDDRTLQEKEVSLKTYNPLFKLHRGPTPSGLTKLDAVLRSSQDYTVVVDIGSIAHLERKTQNILVQTYAREFSSWFEDAGYADVPITIKYRSGLDYEYNSRENS